MIDDISVSNLKHVLSSFKNQPASAGAWDALTPLNTLLNSSHDFVIDFTASTTLGTPVILASPKPASITLFAPLTPRQQQVAELVATGQSNKSIAYELSISLATVKDHVHAILGRLKLSSRKELIANAHRRKG